VLTHKNTFQTNSQTLLVVCSYSKRGQQWRSLFILLFIFFALNLFGFFPEETTISRWEGPNTGGGGVCHQQPGSDSIICHTEINAMQLTTTKSITLLHYLVRGNQQIHQHLNLGFSCFLLTRYRGLTLNSNSGLKSRKGLMVAWTTRCWSLLRPRNLETWEEWKGFGNGGRNLKKEDKSKTKIQTNSDEQQPVKKVRSVATSLGCVTSSDA
jgi:hypothetical protein